MCEEGYSIAMNKNGGLMVPPTGAKTVLVKKGRFFYLRASTREAPTARPLGRGAVLMAHAEVPEAGAEDDAEEEAPPDDDLAPGQADDENEEVEPHVTRTFWPRKLASELQALQPAWCRSPLCQTR